MRTENEIQTMIDFFNSVRMYHEAYLLEWALEGGE